MPPRMTPIQIALAALSIASVFTFAQEQPRSHLRSIDEDVTNFNDIGPGYNKRHQGEPQQQRQSYTCGRAVAQKKLTSLLFQGSLTTAIRPKYRPFEIRTPRIIGGDETNPGEFPWTVSVKLNGQPICGGSLIDKSWILTAAHCVVGYNPRNLTVRLGAYRIKDNTETQAVDSALSLFVVHKHYSMPRPFSNDIALLKMSDPVEFSDFIIPICLPNEDKMTAAQTSDLIDDFNTDFKTNSVNSGGPSPGGVAGDLGGIVVSTKMSDKEISRCFKQLEQNYLNSIGMGTVESSANGPAIEGFVDELSSTGTTQLPLIEDLHSLDEVSSANFARALHFGQHNQKAAAIKLTSLPISNELLREIQSVGSMQSLHLGLQQGDIMAMASDLVADGLPTGNAGNRERVYTTDGGASQGQASFNRQSDRYPARSDPQAQNEINNDDIGNELVNVGGTKYSGELGLVVGWGWVRENDNDDQQAGGGGGGNKGYQSVTLQKVRLPVLRNNDCEAWFRSQEKKITLLPSQFCAGYNVGGKDACRVSSAGRVCLSSDARIVRSTSKHQLTPLTHSPPSPPSPLSPLNATGRLWRADDHRG